MAKPRIYADFHNADSKGRLRLNCVGTVEDLGKQHIELREGQLVNLYSDDLDNDGQLDELLVDGVVAYSSEEQCWVAEVDWAAIHHISDARGGPLFKNGATSVPPTPEHNIPPERRLA